MQSRCAALRCVLFWFHDQPRHQFQRVIMVICYPPGLASLTNEIHYNAVALRVSPAPVKCCQHRFSLFGTRVWRIKDGQFRLCGVLMERGAVGMRDLKTGRRYGMLEFSCFTGFSRICKSHITPAALGPVGENRDFKKFRTEVTYGPDTSENMEGGSGVLDGVDSEDIIRLRKSFWSAERLTDDYVKSWKEELFYISPHRWNSPEWVRSQIDKKCTDNMRMLVVDSVQNVKVGHPGLPLGITEVGYVLYSKVLRYNPQNPRWFNRDRFVLSAGHGCLLQYICLHLAGFDSVKIDDLKMLCQLGTSTPGHPENTTTGGVEVTTGPLGQGVSNAVGLALAEKHLAARFNKNDCTLVNHRTFCIMGDGCAMEGISNEAASLASHWKLNKLTLIYDANHTTIDGHTSLAFSEDVEARFRALGWNTIRVECLYDSLNSFQEALEQAIMETQRPTFIQVESLIGHPSKKEGTSKAHHGTFEKDDVEEIKRKAKWSDKEPFHVIPMVYQEFQKQAEYGMSLDEEWNSMMDIYKEKYPIEACEFHQLLEGRLPSHWEDVLPRWTDSDPMDSTRGYSEKCLNSLARVLPGLIGGSADLAGSNKVHLKNFDDFRAFESPWGRNIHYGVREHAMAGISNGLALHGSGLIPFAATFLIFTDYMKNSMRLSALSHAGVIYICTHDSIGLGEDGPTHQPVEQLAGLRAIPNMLVFRPANGNETAASYKVAISHRNQPSVIALSRQKVESNLAGTSKVGVEKGGYVISDNSNEVSDLILIGTGSELCLCEGAAQKLREEGRKVRVVSLVCWRLFDQQPQEYREAVLPCNVEKRLSVEAGSPLGWREYVGTKGHIMSVQTFGASGSYIDVFKKYGFTVESIIEKAHSLLQ